MFVISEDAVQRLRMLAIAGSAFDRAQSWSRVAVEDIATIKLARQLLDDITEADVTVHPDDLRYTIPGRKPDVDDQGFGESR